MKPKDQKPEDQKPGDDSKFDPLALQKFLQQHRSPAPPPAPDLEDRILAALTPQSHPRRRSWRWQVAGAIAASAIAGLIGYQVWQPYPTATEFAALESFMEASWNDSVAGAAEEDLLLADESN
jgi:hypothetical protein